MSKGLLDAPKLQLVQMFWQNKLLPTPIVGDHRQLCTTATELNLSTIVQNHMRLPFPNLWAVYCWKIADFQAVQNA